MSRFSVRLPETLHKELTFEAKDEGVSLNQYVVYLLARRHEDRYSMVTVPKLEVAQQRERYDALMERLGPPLPKEEAIERLRSLREDSEEISGKELLGVAAASRILERHGKD